MKPDDKKPVDGHAQDVSMVRIDLAMAITTAILSRDDADRLSNDDLAKDILSKTERIIAGMKTPGMGKITRAICNL